MEDIKSGLGNITDSISKVTSTASTLILDRLKHPLIAAFSISWIIFNWKPILYIIFSEENIRTKISFIVNNYNDKQIYFWMPLYCSLFYVIILPYVSLLTDAIVLSAHKWRNIVNLKSRQATLNLQIGAARNEIILEEEKNRFREEHGKNQSLANLNNENTQLKISLEEIKQQNSDKNIVLEQLSLEKTKLNDEINNLRIEHQNEVEIVKNQLYQQQEKLRDFTRLNETLRKKLSYTIFKVFKLQIKETILISTMGHDEPEPPVMILHYVNNDGTVIYFDLLQNEFIQEDNVVNQLNGREINHIIETDRIDAAISIMNSYLN